MSQRAIDVIDDVLWTLGLEHVTKAKPPSPLTSTGFASMVRTIVNALHAETAGARSAGIEQAILQLDRQWKGVSPDERGRVIGSAMTEYFSAATSAASRTGDTFGQQMRSITSKTRAAASNKHQLGLPLDDPFGLVDPQVLAHARNSNALYLRNGAGKISEKLSVVARDVVADGIARGYENRDIATELALALRGTEAKQTRAYLTMVSSVFVARSRQYGMLRSFEEAGITTYEQVSVLDEVTCPVCRFMHGRTFEVRTALRQYEEVAAAAPEAVVDIQPFMRTARLPNGDRVVAVPTSRGIVPIADIDDDGRGKVDARGSFRARLGDGEIQRLGCGCPVHPHCRCTIVPGATQVLATVTTRPKAPPALPPAPPPAQASPAPPALPPLVPAPAAGGPKGPRKPRIPKVPPAPPPPPQGPQFTVGVHAQSFASDIPKREQAALLARLGSDVPGILDFLARVPLDQLEIKKSMSPARANGSYSWGRALRLKVRWDRQRQTWGETLTPPKTWSISTAGSTREDAVFRTLLHELGHHVHLHDDRRSPASFQAVDAIIRAAFRARKGGGGATFTAYAGQDHMEFFAEAFAAYVFHRKALERTDFTMFTMVEDVLAMRKIAL